MSETSGKQQQSSLYCYCTMCLELILMTETRVLSRETGASSRAHGAGTRRLGGPLGGRVGPLGTRSVWTNIWVLTPTPHEYSSAFEVVERG